MGRGRGGRRGGSLHAWMRRDNARHFETQRAINEDSDSGGTMSATSFRDAPQRDDPTVTNTYFNTPGDGNAHGHVKYRNNSDGTTDYLYARDVEGNEYDV
jgi:hypothetical protein